MNIRFLSALAISASISTFTPVLPTAYAEQPCRDNDNNGICDDFCPDFNGDGACDVPGGVGVIAPAPEASNPELILEGTPRGNDPNMPPVPAPVLPDVSEVLPPGNPPPVVQLPENAYVVPTIPPPPVINPDQPYVAPSNPGPPAAPVQRPLTPPPAVEESEIPLLPLPEPPPPAAVPDYLNEPPMVTYDPEDHVTLMPKPYEQPAYQQPSSTYQSPDYTYEEPDYTYPDSGSSYGGSGSSYGDTGSSYGGTVCDEDGYCS